MAAKRERPSRSHEARLERLRKAVAVTAAGKRLLGLADAGQVPIYFSSMKKSAVSDAAGAFDVEDRKIALDPAVGDRDLPHILTHELRHLWQAHIAELTHGPGKYSGADMLVYRRLIEGDAYAYETCAEITPELKKLKNVLRKAEADKPNGPGTKRLRKEFNKLAGEYAMKRQFNEFQKDLGDYDDMTLETQKLELKLTYLHIQRLQVLNAHPEKAEQYAADRKASEEGLREIYARVSAPSPLDDKLLRIPRDGLGRNAPKYLDFDKIGDLAQYIREQIPAATVKKAEAMDATIRRAIEKSGLVR